MSNEKEKNEIPRQESPTPGEDEIFVGPVSEELSPEELFAGDAEFFAQFQGNVEGNATEEEVPYEDGLSEMREPEDLKVSRFSLSQKVLAAAILAVAAIMGYAYLSLPPAKTSASDETAALAPKNQARIEQSEAVHKPETVKEQPKSTRFAKKSTGSASLKAAESLLKDGKPAEALGMYQRLYESIRPKTDSEALEDYLQLKMAVCLQEQEDLDEAGRQLRSISTSESPAIKMLAAVHRAQIELQQKRYLNARTQAYRAIAIAEAVQADSSKSNALLRELHFMLAKAVTLYTLSLNNQDRRLPKELWPVTGRAFDLFTGASKSQLQNLLRNGREKLEKAVLGPEIHETEGSAGKVYTVVSNGAPVEELIARFSSSAGLDTKWALDDQTLGVRRRAVYLYIADAAGDDILRTSAGSNGLLAETDANNVLTITDPKQYESLSKLMHRMAEEAVALWRRFQVRHHQDSRQANAHYAAALVLMHCDCPAEAIAEFKIVANKFPKSALAPHALLNSSRVKTGLRDFAGAHQDLKLLVEQYPDSEFADEACLRLAEAAMQTKMYEEAAGLFAKVYNLAFSRQSREDSALGAGRCCYELGRSDEAAKWLTRYINLVQNRNSTDFATACLLLGRSYLKLGKQEQACRVLKHALAGKLSRDDYAETVMALADGYARQDNYVEALEVLRNTSPEILTLEQAVRLTVIEARVLRKMGLVEQATAALKRKQQYLPNAGLKGIISLELARCSADEGNLGEAQKRLSDTLTTLEPGELARKVQYELAKTCFDLGQDGESLGICIQILESGPSAELRQTTLELMAAAYRRQKNYDKAAKALLGKWEADLPAADKTVSKENAVDSGYTAQ